MNITKENILAALSHISLPNEDQNIVDLVIMINAILEGNNSDACDINNDNEYNIIDVVQLVNIVLEQ